MLLRLGRQAGILPGAGATQEQVMQLMAGWVATAN